jgi:predicted DNA-binding transcriptional regulator AlpA
MRAVSLTHVATKDGPARAVFFSRQPTIERPLASNPARRIFFRDVGRTDTTRTRGSAMIPSPWDQPVMTAEEAFAELGIDRSTGYKAIRDGTFPVPVLRIGRLIRVPTSALRRLLQLDPDPDIHPDPPDHRREECA